jgi:hypothetical protein
MSFKPRLRIRIKQGFSLEIFVLFKLILFVLLTALQDCLLSKSTNNRSPIIPPCLLRLAQKEFKAETL